MSSSLNALTVARRIADRFDEAGISYGIGGALALAAWGSPRATKDVDLSVFVPQADLPRVFDALERAGVIVDRDEATRGVARIGLFTAQAGRMRVDLFLSEHPHFLEMEKRRQAIPDSSGRSLWFISAEDLTVMKLIYGRDKDIIDLERLFAVRPQLDVVYVRHWLDQMVPAGDRRHVTLEDLARRFLNR